MLLSYKVVVVLEHLKKVTNCNFKMVPRYVPCPFLDLNALLFSVIPLHRLSYCMNVSWTLSPDTCPGFTFAVTFFCLDGFDGFNGGWGERRGPGYTRTSHAYGSKAQAAVVHQ